MKRAALNLMPETQELRRATTDRTALEAQVGTVVAVQDGTVPRVEFPGNPHGPLIARVALSAADGERLSTNWKDTEVLIVFANRDVRQPVIVGLVRDNLRDPNYYVGEGFPQLCLTAQDELVLQCGEAKIILRRDGKVTIVGNEILSRARTRHRIRGGSVDIN